MLLCHSLNSETDDELHIESTDIDNYLSVHRQWGPVFEVLADMMPDARIYSQAPLISQRYFLSLAPQYLCSCGFMHIYVFGLSLETKKRLTLLLHQRGKHIASSSVERDEDVTHFTTDRVFGSPFPFVSINSLKESLQAIGYTKAVAVSCVGIKAFSDSEEFNRIKEIVTELHDAAPDTEFESADLAVTLRPLLVRDGDAVLVRTRGTRPGMRVVHYNMCMTAEEMSPSSDTPVPFGSVRLRPVKEFRVEGAIDLEKRPPSEIDYRLNSLDSICVYPSWVHVMRMCGMHHELRRASIPTSASGVSNLKQKLDSDAKLLRDACANGAETSIFRLECSVTHHMGATIFQMIEKKYDVFSEPLDLNTTITLGELRELVDFPLEVRVEKATSILSRAEKHSALLVKYRALGAGRDQSTWKTSLCSYLSALGVSNKLVLSNVHNWPSLNYRLRAELERKKQPKQPDKYHYETEKEFQRRKVKEIRRRAYFCKVRGAYTCLTKKNKFIQNVSAAKRKLVAKKVLHKFGNKWDSKVRLNEKTKVRARSPFVRSSEISLVFYSCVLFKMLKRTS